MDSPRWERLFAIVAVIASAIAAIALSNYVSTSVR